MSDINDGQIEIELDGTKRFLKPTLGAAVTISRAYDGFTNAIRSISGFNFEAILLVIIQGLGLSDQEARGMDEKVYRSGVQHLASPCIRYINVLSNGGRPIKEDKEPGKEGASQ